MFKYLAAIAWFLGTVDAASSQFVGCVTQAAMNNFYSPVSVSYGGAQRTRANCRSRALIQGQQTSFFKQSTGDCFGSSSGPVRTNTLVAGTSPYGDCASGDLQASEFNAANFQGCYSRFIPNNQIAYIFISSSTPHGCYTGCQTESNGYVAGTSVYSVYDPFIQGCNCYRSIGGGQDPANGDRNTGGNYANCDVTFQKYYVWYTDTASPNPSIYRKRAERVEELQRRNRPMGLCPGSLSPCVIEGADDKDSFECVDTTNELESCGGCVGRDLTRRASYKGENCLDIPGIGLGGATCHQGECIVTACDYGYSLVNATYQPSWESETTL